MTLKAKFETAAAAVVIVAAAMFVAGAVENLLLVPPTFETESTFFQTFTPDDVIQRFFCEAG